MSFVIADRVRETTLTTGTGTVTLAGAYTGFQTFSAGIGSGNSTYYAIANVAAGQWEVGIGTYTSGANTLSRTTVLASSNAGSLVNFTNTPNDVFVTQPAERALYVSSGGTGLTSGVAAFTANGVAYASSTTGLATGSALTFDGTNLGVGVTPSAWGGSYKAFELPGGVALTSYSTTGDMQLFANAYSDGGAYRYKTSTYASNYEQYQGKHIWYNTTSGTAGNAITFTQAMTLDASGNLLVGTTSVGPVNANAITIEPSNSRIRVAHGSTGNGTPYIQFDYGGTNIGSITQSTTSSVLYNVTSDIRLKENVVDAPEFGSIIDSIQVRSYDWKADHTHQRAGFIAQELLAVAPEAVHQPADPEEMMAVDYSKLVPMLVKEIQSLRARLKAANIA